MALSQWGVGPPTLCVLCGPFLCGECVCWGLGGLAYEYMSVQVHVKMRECACVGSQVEMDRTVFASMCQVVLHVDSHHSIGASFSLLYFSLAC